MQFHIGIIALALCLLTHPQAHANDFKASSQTSLTISDGLAWLEVDVLGRSEPLHFVLDTGAGVSVINAETASELELKPGRAVRVQGTQGTAKARWVKGIEARVAGSKLPSKLLSLDLSNISAVCYRRIDGLLGADFLNEHRVQLDFAEGVIRLNETCESFQPNAIKLAMAKRNDAWCIAAHVNSGKPGWFRVDTGFDGQLSWCPAPGRSVSKSAGSTVALEVGSDSRTKTEVQLGPLKLASVTTRILPSQLFNRESGLIGLGILRQYRVTFEADRQVVVLEPTGD